MESNNWFKKKLAEFKGDKEFEFEGALLAFEEELIKRQLPCPPEFVSLVDKHFCKLF